MLMIVFYLSLFFGGLFLVNGIPHFFNGVSGRKFPTPFAKPFGKGESPAVANILWGGLNFFIAYLLLWEVGHFDYRMIMEFSVVFAGALLGALYLATRFEKYYS